MTQEDVTGSDTQNESEAIEFDALGKVVTALRPLSTGARQRVLASVSAFLGITGAAGGATRREPLSRETSEQPSRFSTDRTPTPKEFLLEKRPSTDVDRIACLAYYLTHYRDVHHFKTLDLSKLNTEAAQLKFSNAAQATENAAKAGLLVPAIKGAKQISALGEVYVQALPDKDAAKKAIAHAKPRRKSRRSANDNDTDE